VRRVGHLLQEVVAFDNLVAAYRLARRGKRGRPAVERFAVRLEPELLRLQAELWQGTWRPGLFVHFTVHDPKERQIAVAPFRDRVVHHAIIRVLQPYLEHGMDDDSYGCRTGKGTDAALERALQLGRRYPHCLKVDIQSFFASVRHEVLLGQLGRLCKDRRLMQLLGVLIREGSPGGQGLPIGSLTSQWFANLHLTAQDRYLREQPEALALVRYMDDTLVFGLERAALWGLARRLDNHLQTTLGLQLKPGVTQVYATRTGVPFLGLRVTRQGLEVRRPTWRRITRRLRRAEREYRLGRLSLEGLQASTRSRIAHLQRARSAGLRRRFLGDHAPVEW
jgi:hypothetical protein